MCIVLRYCIKCEAVLRLEVLRLWLKVVMVFWLWSLVEVCVLKLGVKVQ